MSRPRLIALLLAFATLLVYLPVGGFGFLDYDDNEYVTENPHVTNGLTPADITWAFTASHSGNWHPLTWISHMLDCELFKLNPGGHHFVNVLFHAANAALLFLLLVRLACGWPAAAFIAALFAWHPLHVESVAWVAERKDVLSTFFALLALLAYAKYAQENCRRSYGLALVWFALGLMAKPMLVTLPCVMLLLDAWLLRRLDAATLLRLLPQKIPFFVLTVASCIATFIAQKSDQAVISLATLPFYYRLENAPLAVVNYVLKLFWPVDLCAFYPIPDAIAPWQVIGAVAILILITGAAWHWRATKPYLLVGWLWFVGTLVPVIGLIQVGGQAMADRYTYIPSIGFFIAVVLLARDFAAQIKMPPAVAGGLMALVAAGCILVTEHQLPFWRDSETLFRRALAISPHNDVAMVNLGVALEEQGRNAEALDLYRQAEKIDSSRYQLHNNIGNILSAMGRPEDALAEYRKALELRPHNPFLHVAAGMELAELGRFDEALQEYTKAEADDSSFGSPHFEAGKVLFKLGRDAEGMDEFRAALRLDGENFKFLAGIAHYLAASDDDAVRDGKTALPLAAKANVLSGQNQPVVFDILGMALAETGDFTNAITCAQNAFELATNAQLQQAEQIQARLELYRQSKPWRESFRATNAPEKK